MHYFALLLGGACGTLARFLLSGWIQRSVPGRFFWGTLTVNILGCFLIGLLYVIGYQKQWVHHLVLTFLVIGFCGAFTTFSTYVLEFHKLVEQGHSFHAFLYGLVSILLGYLFFHGGLLAGRLLSHGS